MPDALPWVRLYRSFLDNAKTGSLSLSDKGAYLTLLLLASSNSPRGSLPDLKTISKHFGGYCAGHPSRVSAILKRLQIIGLIDQDNLGMYSIHNYSKRQWMANTANSRLNSRAKSPEDVLQINEIVPKLHTKNPGTDTEGTAAARAFASQTGFLKRLESIYNSCIVEWRVASHNCWLPVFKPVSTSPIAIDGSENKAGLGDFRLTAVSGNGNGGEDSASVPGKRLPQKRVGFDAVWRAWNNSPGLIHHKSADESDHTAFRLAYDRIGGYQGLLVAIERYSLFVVGSRTGKYRPCYKWTFYEFLTRKRSDLVRRFISDQWEITCLPFDKPKAQRSVASLLKRAIG
jgi:hypothetical protein